jgi:hypothetical protein
MATTGYDELYWVPIIFSAFVVRSKNASFHQRRRIHVVPSDQEAIAGTGRDMRVLRQSLRRIEDNWLRK